MPEPSSDRPSIAIVGAGGVGALLAALLTRAGNDVRLLARGSALAAIRARGVRLTGPDGESVTPIARASDDPEALGAADIVVVTVKTWQLAELGPRLVSLTAARGLVVPMQNGVEASEIVARSLGGDRVIGGVCRVNAWAEQPGEIRWIGGQPSLVIGAIHPEQRAAVDACAAALRTGVEIVIAPDIQRARWLKLMFIAPYGAVGAVERAPAGEIRRSPASRANLEAAMREVGAVAAARGVPLPPEAVAGTLRRIDELPPDATASMQRDIAAGRPSELADLIGAVVRIGRDAGVATPVSAALFAALEPLEHRARAI
jgi:2-dehydropantoate 2-reductase